jgi:hypothetical protein
VEGPQFHFGVKYSDNLPSKVALNPGPGQYSPEKLKKYDKKYSFGVKTDRCISLGKDRPGPGNYGHRSFLAETYGTGKFGTDRKDKDFMSKTVMENPGPGAYRAEKVSEQLLKSPGVKFGTSSRNNGALKAKLGNPGPGSYTIDNSMGKEGPKYSLSPKRENLKAQEKVHNPGPGNYNPKSSFAIKSAPKFRFSRATRISMDDRISKLPGPLDYMPKDCNSIKKDPPSFGFGTGKRPALSKNNASPGPGNYTLPSMIREGPGFKMGIRVRPKKPVQQPRTRELQPIN